MERNRFLNQVHTLTYILLSFWESGCSLHPASACIHLYFLFLPYYRTQAQALYFSLSLLFHHSAEYKQKIELYHQHGEMEQFHSEIKSDMDVERLPSGKFDTNELVLELTILAYNILRIIGQSSLKGPHAVRRRHEVKRLRLKTVIKNLILIAGHVVKHARKVFLRLGRSNI